MRNRIHLLIITDTSACAGAGCSHEALRLGRSLDPEQFAVAVIALHHGPFAIPSDNPHIPVHRLGLTGSTQPWNPLARWKLARLVRDMSPDCLCTIGPQARLLGMRVAGQLRIPTGIALVDDMGCDLSPGLLTSLQQVNRETPRFVATSFAVAQRLVRQELTDRDRIDVIPHGIDCTRFPERSPDTIAEAKHKMGLSLHQPLVVMAADFLPHKDHETFLGAVVYLKSLAANARYIIIGEGTEGARDTITAKIASYGIADRVQLIGDPENYHAWLAAADVGVLTSYGESCSRTLLTYMAAGLPTVATATGGNPELIRHNECGYLVQPCEADHLATYLMLLLMSPDLCLGFGRAARARAAENFSAENESRLWSDYLRTVVFTTS